MNSVTEEWFPGSIIFSVCSKFTKENQHTLVCMCACVIGESSSLEIIIWSLLRRDWQSFLGSLKSLLFFWNQKKKKKILAESEKEISTLQTFIIQALHNFIRGNPNCWILKIIGMGFPGSSSESAWCMFVYVTCVQFLGWDDLLKGMATTPVFWSVESRGLRSLAATAHGITKSQTRAEWLNTKHALPFLSTFSFLTYSICVY